MAEELDDGEFWLPPQFLTDDDILMDFSTPNGSEPDSSSGTGSDPITENEDDELLSLLAHQLARSSIGVCDMHSSKGWVLSSSPKSTLCGCVGKDGSSLGSPMRPSSPPSEAAEAATWNLLKEAAGEVAKVKVRRENKGVISGTGFFDCSIKPQLRTTPHPPPPPKANNFNCPSHPQFHRQPLPPQGLVWGQVQAANAPLRLPPSAWPPLQGQNHHQQGQNHRGSGLVLMGQPGLKRECVGTGVFLPRQAPAPAQTRKKPDGNEKKARSGKGQPQKRKNSRPSTACQSEIKLPKEWTY